VWWVMSHVPNSKTSPTTPFLLTAQNYFAEAITAGGIPITYRIHLGSSNTSPFG
jgi:hypothetical protein